MNTLITIRVPQELLAVIETQARRTRRTRTAMILALVDQGLASAPVPADTESRRSPSDDFAGRAPSAALSTAPGSAG